MDIGDITTNKGAGSVYYGLRMVQRFDELGTDVTKTNPTLGKGGRFSIATVRTWDARSFNVGKSSNAALYTKEEADPLFIGWVMSSPTGNNLLQITKT
jgi:hypothetical protein